MTNETKTYPCADQPSYAERKHFNIAKVFDLDMKVVATGEFRPPKAGDWFLSGARIAGYRAKNDLSTAYQIARLVRTKTTTVTVETIIGDDDA